MDRLSVTFYEWDCCGAAEFVDRYGKKSVTSNVERKNAERIQGMEVGHIIIVFKCFKLGTCRM